MILQVWWNCEVSFSWTTYFTFVLVFISLGDPFFVFVLLMSFVGNVLSIAIRTNENLKVTLKQENSGIS
jgi:hypothetical protein